MNNISQNTKRILIVTETFLIGGLETRIQSQCTQFIKNNIEVFFLVGKRFCNDLVPEGIKKVFSLDLFNPTATVNALSYEINTIRSIINDNEIDLVLVHPFLSIPSAVISAKSLGIRCGIVLHGPSSLTSFGSVYQLLLQLSLNVADFIEVVSEEIESIVKLFINHNRIFIETNKISYNIFLEKNKNLEQPISIALVSRLDNDKIQSVRNFIEMMQHSNYAVTIFGSGNCESELIDCIEKNGIKNITIKGSCNSLPSVLSDFDIVAGMGRAALEGLALNKPTVLISQDGIKGIIDINLFKIAKHANCSGRHLTTLSKEEFFIQLESCVSHRENFCLRDQLKNEIALEASFKNYLQLIYSHVHHLTEADLYFIENTIDLIHYSAWKASSSSWMSDSKLFDDLNFLLINQNYNDRLKKFLLSYVHYQLFQQALAHEQASHQATKHQLQQSLAQQQTEHQVTKHQLEQLLIKEQADHQASKQQLEQALIKEQIDHQISKQQFEQVLAQRQDEFQAALQKLEQAIIKEQANYQVATQQFQQALVQGQTDHQAIKFQLEQTIIKEQADHQTAKHQFEITLAQLRTDFQNLEQQMNQAIQFNQYVLSSFSWKITRGLRIIRKYLSFLRYFLTNRKYIKLRRKNLIQ